MDKTLIIDDGINGSPIRYTLTPRINPVCQALGIWICLSVPRNVSTQGAERPLNHAMTPAQGRVFNFYSISHLYDGAGFHWQPEQGITLLAPGDCIITPPGTIHAYGAYKNKEGKPYVEDNICFAGPVADNLFRQGVIQNRIVRIGTERVLKPIIDKALNPMNEFQMEATLQLLSFLMDIHFEHLKEPSGLNAKLEGLTQRILQNPARWWTVSEMAEACSLSESYFRLAFQKFSGMPPKLYVDKIKMGIATRKLINTNMKIQELASHLGYMDPYHFSRRFKQIIGASPIQYRNGLRPR